MTSALTVLIVLVNPTNSRTNSSCTTYTEVDMDHVELGLKLNLVGRVG